MSWRTCPSSVARRSGASSLDTPALALGGAGDIGPPPKKHRKLPRVWRGKDLDMIVFGRDERLVWARKRGMFLARARTALGDRRLHRNAWGGSVLDSVLGAMLTQNVSDVLSSSAIMNLAAKFPGEGATAAPRATAPPEAFFEGNDDDRMRAATSVSAPPSAETLSVVNETVAALVAGAVETAEAAAAVRGGELVPGTRTRPRANVEDENQEDSVADADIADPAGAGLGGERRVGVLAAGGVARPPPTASPPSTPAAAGAASSFRQRPDSATDPLYA